MAGKEKPSGFKPGDAAIVSNGFAAARDDDLHQAKVRIIGVFKKPKVTRLGIRLSHLADEELADYQRYDEEVGCEKKPQ